MIMNYTGKFNFLDRTILSFSGFLSANRPNFVTIILLFPLNSRSFLTLLFSEKHELQAMIGLTSGHRGLTSGLFVWIIYVFFFFLKKKKSIFIILCVIT